MGLDIVVYRNKDNLDLGKNLDEARVDVETGEVYFENEKIGREIPSDLLKAAEYRIGNIAKIAALREETAMLLGPENQINHKVLYSGSHAGDVVPVEQLPALAGEINNIQKMDKASKELRQFVEKLKALINAAATEHNPIVFV